MLTNPHVEDIGQTLTNNSVHAPWMGELELKNTWIMIDNFLFFVRKQQTNKHTNKVVLTAVVERWNILIFLCKNQ